MKKLRMYDAGRFRSALDIEEVEHAVAFLYSLGAYLRKREKAASLRKKKLRDRK